MKKEHKVLKFFMPMLACIYGLALSLLCASVNMQEEFVLYRSLLSKLLEIVAIIVTVLLIKKVLPKVFPQVKEYKMVMPPVYVLVAIFLIVPLWIIVKYKLIYIVTSCIGNVDLQTVVYSASELKEDLVACISAFFLAPVYEELSFRYLALSAFKKKSSQIIFGCFVALFFGILHMSNYIGAFMDAIIFMLLFVLTKNIVLSIWTHCCYNIMVMVFSIMSYLGVWEISKSSYPTVIRVENISATIISCILAIIGIVIMILGYKKHAKVKE
uniref:CPBP family intramembrane glutamic endopeptidase n=1 Tax=Acetatifactor sp. TaxID=1872090 RepID=UPI00405789F4